MEIEKPEKLFSVSPQFLNLSEGQDSFTFSIKNLGSRVNHYEIFVPNWNHFKIFGDRTFSLAPGISKNVKIKHIRPTMCTT